MNKNAWKKNSFFFLIKKCKGKWDIGLLNLELRYEQKQYQTQTKDRGRVEPNRKGKIDLVPNLCFSTQEGIQNMDMFKKIDLYFF